MLRYIMHDCAIVTVERADDCITLEMDGHSKTADKKKCSNSNNRNKDIQVIN